MKSEFITAVGVAIIDKQKKVFIAKRPPGKALANKWEFPGGKLEVGESLQECGAREIKEELCIDVSIKEYLGYEEFRGKEDDFCLHIYTAKKADEDHH